MLLMSAVVVMSEFMHEDMQKHKGTSLSLREATSNLTLETLVRNAKPLKDFLVGVEIRRNKFSPKIIRPSVKKNRTGFLAMIKFISTIVLAVTR